MCFNIVMADSCQSHFSKHRFRETMPLVFSIVGFPLRVCIKARLVGSYVFNRVMMDSCQKSLIQSIGFLKPCKHCYVPNMSRSKLIRTCVWTRDFSIFVAKKAGPAGFTRFLLGGIDCSQTPPDINSWEKHIDFWQTLIRL